MAPFVVAFASFVLGAEVNGEALFARTCSTPYCHGARGMAGRAPALRGRTFGGDELRGIIADGIPGTSMPPFGGRLSPEEIGALADYILSISVASVSIPVAAPEEAPPEKTAGDRSSGEALFFDLSRGRCSTCHRFGRSDFPGPDLGDLGKRPFEILRDIVEPAYPVSPDKGLVEVTTRDGDRFRAIRHEETESFVRLHDLSSALPVLRRIAPSDLVSIAPLEGSGMPNDFLDLYSAGELLDLVRYLSTEGVVVRPGTIGDLFYPPGLKPGEKLPAVVMSHDGGGLGPDLNDACAPYLAGEGFVVLTIDHRGSNAPEDAESALDFIGREEHVDPERIGYWGASYSGGRGKYPVFSGLTRDDLDGGISIEALSTAISWFQEHLKSRAKAPP